MVFWNLWNEIYDSQQRMAANMLGVWVSDNITKTTHTEQAAPHAGQHRPVHSSPQPEQAPAPVQAPAEQAGHATHHFDVVEYLKQVGGITVCVLDEAGQGLSFAPNWEKQTGLQPTQCMGNHFKHFFHPQHREVFQEKLRMTQSGAEQVFRLQYGSTHCGYRWYECTLSPVSRRQGEAAIHALTLRDVSKEMEMSRQVHTYQSEAELALRGRAEFLGHMSHELRTPLNAMLGFAEMMEQGVYGEITHDGYQDYLKNIRESGHMLLDRITDMMEISSIEVGSAAMEEIVMEPNSLLEMAKNLHHHQAIMRGITLVETNVHLMVLIRCDRAKLVRALGNIINNSIRFSEPGSEVHLTCELLKDKRLAFHITDNGEGMSPRQMEALQEALSRSYCMFSGSPDAIGLGLGLAVAKEFAHLHDGELKLHSIKGEGTHVTLILPPDRVTSMEVPMRQRRRKPISA